MEGLHVCLVGNTLLAEGLAKLLHGSDSIGGLDCFPTVGEAVSLIKKQAPDALILADVATSDLTGNDPLQSTCPEMTVICIDHQSDVMKLITITCVSASLPNLINSILTLHRPKLRLHTKLIHPENLYEGEKT